MPSLAPDWKSLAVNPWKAEEILVTVKAYPNPSRKYIETVCVAGVRKSGEWVRLFPIPYRLLAYEQQFPTYGWIKANIRKSPKDFRPESYNIDVTTLKVIDVERDWQTRRRLLLPLVSQSVEDLLKQQQAHKTSLGLIRPKKIKRLIIQTKILSPV
jgi:hypothetical protein